MKQFHLTRRSPQRARDFVPQKMLRDTEKRANSAQQVPLSILILMLRDGAKGAH